MQHGGAHRVSHGIVLSVAFRSRRSRPLASLTTLSYALDDGQLSPCLVIHSAKTIPYPFALSLALRGVWAEGTNQRRGDARTDARNLAPSAGSGRGLRQAQGERKRDRVSERR